MTTKEEQQAITPDKALQLLKEGNTRFVNGKTTHRNLPEEVHTTGTQGQFPFATILCCIDSRVLAEAIFDVGIGDLFSVQLAGNVVDGDAIGSMEFATKLAGTKLLVVLGHTKCGAVKGAYNNAQLGSLTGLVNKIKPAIEEAGTDDLDEISAVNAKKSLREILEKSPTIKELVDDGSIKAVSAMYDVENGEVTWH